MYKKTNQKRHHALDKHKSIIFFYNCFFYLIIFIKFFLIDNLLNFLFAKIICTRQNLDFVMFKNIAFQFIN